MRPDHIRLPTPPAAAAAEAARAAAYERKQRWKEQPGSRYTPEELREMSGEFADCVVVSTRPKRRMMRVA